jgi:glycosyltransferase involved in cell wall biosynthesis
MTTPVGKGKVSIVIPCYNRGAMLSEALASIERVRNETLLEVIIVDDGSSDADTIRILDEATKAGYSVVSQPNRGPGAARNTGIRLAKGEFILPLDSDNRLRDVYLDEGVSLLKNKPSIGVIYADAEYFGQKSGRWHVQEFSLLSLIRMNFIDVCALYRKKLWEEVDGYDEQIICMSLEDWDFWLRVARHGGRFVHLPKIGFDYRVGSGSVLGTAFPRYAEIVNYIFNKPEMACYKLVRETVEELRTWRVLAPARLFRKLWRNARAIRKDR